MAHAVVSPETGIHDGESRANSGVSRRREILEEQLNLTQLAQMYYLWRFTLTLAPQTMEFSAETGRGTAKDYAHI